MCQVTVCIYCLSVQSSITVVLFTITLHFWCRVRHHKEQKQNWLESTWHSVTWQCEVVGSQIFSEEGIWVSFWLIRNWISFLVNDSVWLPELPIWKRVMICCLLSSFWSSQCSAPVFFISCINLILSILKYIPLFLFFLWPVGELNLGAGDVSAA